MPKALPNNYSLSNEPGLWFQNRGLFSKHFLKARLPQWKEWQDDGEVVLFRKQLLSLYESIKATLPLLNEPQTEKQSKRRGFLTWIEKEILRGFVEEQKNKTKLKGFHNNSFEDLLGVLKKNKAVKDPCPADTRDTIATEFSAPMKALTPLKSRIEATDKLIDQVVYKLYNLTDDEIAIVTGQQNHDTVAQN